MKKIRDRSTTFHFLMMVAFGAFPFGIGGLLVKTFWDIVPALDKAKFSDFLTWQFAFVFVFYAIGFPLSFWLGSLSKCHAELLHNRLKKDYMGID